LRRHHLFKHSGIATATDWSVQGLRGQTLLENL
jgi:hypothetical protein